MMDEVADTNGPGWLGAADGALVAAFVAGDRAAFAELVRRHVDMVYATARRVAPEDAEDVAQAVFLLLAQKARRLRREPTLAPWLHKTARYCALNARKVRQRRTHHELQAGAAMANAAASDQPSPLCALLDEALADLPAAERAAVLLRHLQGKSVEQTAEALQISTAAAGKRALRGMQKLRRLFARRGFPAAAVGLAGVLAAEAARAAPASLVAAIAAPPSAAAVALAALTGKSLSGVVMKSTLIGTSAAGAAALALWAATLAHAQHPAAIATSAPAPAATAPAPTGDLVLASYALLLEQPAADRLRALSTPVPATDGRATFYELRTAHMADIRKLLHDGQHNANYAMAYDFPEHLPANPPRWQSKWGWQEFTMQQFGHGGFSTYISANLGDAFAQQSPGTAELRDGRAHLSLNFDNQRVQQAVYILNADFSTQTSDIPWLQTTGSIHWNGDLAPGDAFLALGSFTQMPGAPLTVVAVCETARMPAEEAQFLQTCQDSVRWLSEGPEGLRRDADRALVWGYANRLSHTDERALQRQWTRTIAGGVKVSLEAIGDSTQSPFIWWDPAGNATVATRYNTVPHGSLALALHVAAPPPDPNSGPYDYDNIESLPAGATRATLYIAGPNWTDQPIAVGQTVTLPTGETVTFQKIQPAGDDLLLAEIGGSVAAPLQVSIAAVTHDGKRVIADNSDIKRALFAAGNEVPLWKHSDANVFVKAGDVDHWVLLTRKREAVTFENFALRPQADPAEATLDASELHAAHLLASKDLALHDGQRVADHLDDLDALPRDPGTPMGVMHLLVDAADSDNAVEVQKYLTGANAPAAAATAKALAAVGSMYCRAEKKFGRVEMAQACENHQTGFALQDSFLGNPWKINDTGDTATTDGSQRVVRNAGTGGLWKLDVSSMTGNIAPAVVEARMNTLTQGAAAISAELDAGRIPDAQSAADRMQKLMQQSP